jgi:hypothetical protein
MTATTVLPPAMAPMTHPAPSFCPPLTFGFAGPLEVDPDPESPVAGAEEGAADAEEAGEDLLDSDDADDAAEAEEEERTAAEDLGEDIEDVADVIVVMDAIEDVDIWRACAFVGQYVLLKHWIKRDKLASRLTAAAVIRRRHANGSVARVENCMVLDVNVAVGRAAEQIRSIYSFD